MIITEIAGYLILIEFIYALYLFPKALGESRGAYREPADPFFGKMKEDCRWIHGITFRSAAIGFIILIPLLIIIQEVSQKYIGIPGSALLILLIILIVKYYERNKTKANKIEADMKNKAEGRLVKK
ncbi:hypothetical protein [Methanosphaera sp. WGK6]|uniref:hypothetical protein n=1 Tax=Methanosphaera sp. WGK6 TaxID=1561964 RepID=UPI00084C27B2|nr:hypothetical protein [Methanosphaera sp. WGK6]OED30353.1 hypothetical protein NL43_02965 [Methanosphaera sp. WGK6]